MTLFSLRSQFWSDFDQTKARDLESVIALTIPELGLVRIGPELTPDCIVKKRGSLSKKGFLTRKSNACSELSCGAGSAVKLTAAAQFCPVPAKFDLELKVCVDVISDILGVIGHYIPAAESFFNSFGVYGGCYRLGPYKSRSS